MAELFAQRMPITTISEISRIHHAVDAAHFFGCYAYATQSGVYSFSNYMGENFWENTSSKWLLGIDYGRTHPEALKSILEQSNSEVRIHDGDWIIEKKGFIPRRDFHPKTALMWDQAVQRHGVVVGSGNLSSNGLSRSVEFGTARLFDTLAEYEQAAGQLPSELNGLWEDAAPADGILERYTDRWNEEFSWSSKASEVEGIDASLFWIEAGYVTQNRVPRPGNQIDFPKGMNRYFGFDVPDDLAKNSVIGAVTMVTAIGDPTTRNLRFANNSMEKISLPIPETHGFENYDGKILVFERQGDAFVLHALEADDFDAAFGSRIANVHSMGSGRQYGIIV
jgi:hypothetical protein